MSTGGHLIKPIESRFSAAQRVDEDRSIEHHVQVSSVPARRRLATLSPAIPAPCYDFVNLVIILPHAGAATKARLPVILLLLLLLQY